MESTISLAHCKLEHEYLRINIYDQHLHQAFIRSFPHSNEVSKFKPTRLSRSIFHVVCVRDSSFIIVPANRRVYATRSRRAKDYRRSERKIWAKSGQRDLDTSLKVEHHRFARGQPARIRRNTIGAAQG